LRLNAWAGQDGMAVRQLDEDTWELAAKDGGATILEGGDWEVLHHLLLRDEAAVRGYSITGDAEHGFEMKDASGAVVAQGDHDALDKYARKELRIDFITTEYNRAQIEAWGAEITRVEGGYRISDPVSGRSAVSKTLGKEAISACYDVLDPDDDEDEPAPMVGKPFGSVSAAKDGFERKGSMETNTPSNGFKH